mgnify:CR=1 FL=1
MDDETMLKDRAYYENKRMEIMARLNLRDVRNRNQKYGDKYGFTLASPFEESEVSDFELKYDVEIPKGFRDYLTTISRETIDCYPYTIRLDMDNEDDNDNGYEHYLDEDGFDIYYHLGDGYFDKDRKMAKIVLDLIDNNEEEKLNKLGFYKNYFIQIYDNGYSDCNDNLCIKGIHYGKIGKHGRMYDEGFEFFSAYELLDKF